MLLDTGQEEEIGADDQWHSKGGDILVGPEKSQEMGWKVLEKGQIRISHGMVR